MTQSLHLDRRQLGRAAVLLAAGAALPFYNEAALAQDTPAGKPVPPGVVKINANENPMGPCAAALAAVAAIVPQGGRYLNGQSHDFTEALAAANGLPSSHVLAAAGSSDPLHRVVLAYTAKDRPLVTASPGYEAPERAAEFVGARVIAVPLRKDYAHDVEAMAKADAATGVIYVCNPNNPTGTVTRKDDIDLLLAKKPKGSILLIDEAYLHFSTTATSAMPLVAAGKDVIVLRTFSKIYGMAGLRAGAAFGRPDLLDRVRGFGGVPLLPITGVAGALASLKDQNVVPDRRREFAALRADLFAWLDTRGFRYIPSEANMVMIDGKRPAQAMIDALLEKKVAVGRPWPALPTHIRVTIGTREEMTLFKAAFAQTMNA